MIQLQDVDLKLLRVFMTVVRCGGFSAAQATLNVSQSTISEQMTTLETRLGLKLCERGRSGFRLTEHGMATYEAAQRLQVAVESFCADTGALKKQISGKLYLGIIDNTVTDAASPLPQTLQDFVSRGHDVHLDVYIGTPAELEERVLDGRLHIAVGHFPLHVPGLTYTELYDEPDGLYCGKNHPLAGRSADEGSLDEGVASSRVVARGYLQQHDLRMLKASKAAATVDNIEAQAILILSGAYIGFLPIHYAARWVARGEMYQIGPDQFGSRWPFCAIIRRAAVPPTILQVFVIDLMENFHYKCAD
ncbi:LysR family transcriptional regulator [Paraburkholderia sp. BL10I2N1]|uniref:LysR family transcriptional regulator n=1 Tax=Paraburkholderia sp. BL10I2N1 TaxID=1938796 RepID=UPI001060BCE8|nr:LysR family transcriptional regulator [Paraburkholderia sp. BL10I2N1]TDN58692.1 DNA-binding transcriptional LysR family regulator [Paraburkholderia sp. BL10I2N1]